MYSYARFCIEVRNRMQNVHRIIAKSLWIVETHCICERSIYHLVFSRSTAVGHKTAALQHCLGVHDPACWAENCRQFIVILGHDLTPPHFSNSKSIKHVNLLHIGSYINLSENCSNSPQFCSFMPP